MGLSISLLAATHFVLFTILAALSARWRARGGGIFRLYFALMAASYFVAGSLEIAGFGGTPLGSAAYPLQALFSTLLFSFFASDLTGVKKLKAIAIIFAALVFLMPDSSGIWRAEYLVSILVGFVSYFIIYEFAHGGIKNAGLLGLVATGASAAVLFAGVPEDASGGFFFVPNIFLALGYAALLGFGPASRFILPRKIEFEIDGHTAFSHVARPLMHLILYLSLLNVVLMLGALALHESGHLWVGSKLGCTGEAVLFDSSKTGPHTSLSCPPGTSESVLALAGFIFVIPFSAIFFFLRGYPEKNFGVVILGIALVMGSLDFSVVVPGKYVVYSLMIAGTLLICLGEALLINAYISPEKKREEKKQENTTFSLRPSP